MVASGGSPHLEFRVGGALHHKVPLEYVVLHVMYTKPQETHCCSLCCISMRMTSRVFGSGVCAPRGPRL